MVFSSPSVLNTDSYLHQLFDGLIEVNGVLVELLLQGFPEH